MAAAPPLPHSFEEASRLSLEVEAELDRVCLSAQFHSSKRSCEFLRYVVRVALDGRIDSLKERSIGIDLLGRDTSYDPSSDATVRVRANEVRKRLASYYGSNPRSGAFHIALPVGNYVPRFVPAGSTLLKTRTEMRSPALPRSDALAVFSDLPDDRPEDRPENLAQPRIAPLSALVRMRPAMLALLVCVLLLRQQLEGREGYLCFWDHFLTGRTAMQLSFDNGSALATGVYPLVWIAGRYGEEATIGASSPNAEPSAHTALVRIARSSPPDWRTETGLHWQLNGSQTHAALLTLLPEEPDTLYLQASDDQAMSRICEELTSSRRFPSGLWPMASGNKPVQLLVHQDAAGRWDDELWPKLP